MSAKDRGTGRKVWGVADRKVGAMPRIDGKSIAEDLRLVLNNVALSVRRPGAASDAALKLLEEDVSAALWRLEQLGPDVFDPLVNANSFALTAGQVMQLTRLVDAREAALDPFQQPGLVMQYTADGPSGAGLYAWKEGEEAAPMLLDGRWQQ